MEVNIYLVLFKIKQKIPSIISNISHEVVVNRPIFPSKREKNKKHIVVVGKDDIQQFVAHKEYPLVIYAGVSQEEIQSVHCNYLIFPKSYTIASIFNELTEVFDLLEEWYVELEKATNEYFSYNAILNSCSLFIDAPIALTDTQFKYICYTKRFAFLSGYDRYVQDDVYLPLEEVNYLNSLPDFKALEEKKEVFHYVAVESLLHKNIFHNGSYIARLSIPYDSDEITNLCYKSVLNIFATYIERLYNNLGTFRRLEKQDSVLKELLVKLLEQKNVESNELSELLKVKKYKKDDTYYLIQFSSAFTSTDKETAKALASRLEMQMQGATCFEYDKKMIALVNDSYFNRVNSSYFMKQLSYYLRDSLLQAGVSRAFFDLYTLPTAYRQTNIAFELGVAMDSTSWCFRFNDYAFDYVLKHGYYDFAPEQICHLAIMKLRDYDKKHNTELDKTLRTYIQSQYNASACARLLYINRSSFLKRMERIEQLTKIDLANFKERLYIEISYMIIEKKESY